MSPTIVLAGGGTAGHVNPLLATADALRARGCTIVVLGTAQGLESDLVPAAGYHLVTIPMRASFNSLNASAAAAVILFEIARRGH